MSDAEGFAVTPRGGVTAGWAQPPVAQLMADLMNDMQSLWDAGLEPVLLTLPATEHDLFSAEALVHPCTGRRIPVRLDTEAGGIRWMVVRAAPPESPA